MGLLTIQNQVDTLQKQVDGLLKIKDLSVRASVDGTEYLPVAVGEDEYKVLLGTFFKGRWKEKTEDYTLAFADQNSKIEFTGDDLTVTIPEDLGWAKGDQIQILQKGTGFAVDATAVTGNLPQTLVDTENSMYIITKQDDNEFSIIQIGVASSSVELLDEDDFASNSDTKGATQQSIKAYIDAQVNGGTDIDPDTDIYADVTALIADQNAQEEGQEYFVTDATGFTTITSGGALVLYLGTTDGDEEDYVILSNPGASNTELTTDELDAIENANLPSASNPFATQNDVIIESLGVIYKKSVFTDTSEFTERGDLTATTSSGKLRVTTPTEAVYTEFFTYDNYITSLQKFVMKIRFEIVNVPNSTSYGLGIGLKSQASGEYEHFIQFSMTDINPSGGRFLLKNNYNGTVTDLYDSLDDSILLPFQQNDIIEIEIEQYEDVLKGIVRNVTTNNEVSGNYRYSPSSTIIPNISKFAVYIFGGTYDIEDITISSKEYKNANLLIVGDSKATGYTADYFSTSYASKLNNRYGRIANVSGGSERTTDVLNRIDELIALTPKKVLLAIGCNDKRDSTPVLTWAYNYDSVVFQLESAGIIVYHLLKLNENVLTFTDYNNHIINNYDADKIIDIGTVTLAADGIHPDQEGHTTIFNKIVDKIGFEIAEPNYKIKSNPDKDALGSKNISNIVAVKQDEYDSMDVSPTTIYIITDA